MMKSISARGMTLIEVVIASMITVVVAAGTMTAFVTAVRISRSVGGSETATFQAQQTIERFRNHIGCDDPWFDPASCVGKAQAVGGAVAYSFTPSSDDFDGDGDPDYYIMQTKVTY